MSSGWLEDGRYNKSFIIRHYLFSRDITQNFIVLDFGVRRRFQISAPSKRSVLFSGIVLFANFLEIF